MKVGDKVYLKPVNNQARYIKNTLLDNIKEATIEKIGKKYFYIKEYPIYKFGIEKMQDISNYCANYEVYLSLQEIKDEEEYSNLLRDIDRELNKYGKIDLSLEQLRKIKEIIDSNKTN